jgi:hypothetical protein
MLGAYIVRVTEDTLVHNGACLLFRVRPQVAVAGQIVELYDGQDMIAGVLRDKIICDVNVPTSADYGPGAYFANGLFVHVHTAGDAATVVYTPLPLGQ